MYNYINDIYENVFTVKGDNGEPCSKMNVEITIIDGGDNPSLMKQALTIAEKEAKKWLSPKKTDYYEAHTYNEVIKRAYKSKGIEYLIKEITE